MSKKSGVTANAGVEAPSNKATVIKSFVATRGI